MLTKKPLNNFAEILPGYSFRIAIEPSKNGNISVIQAKDISSDEFVSELTPLTRISLDSPKTSARVCRNDVLLVSRGAAVHKATVFKSKADDVIASSSLFVIRVSSPDIIPEYLSLFLNSPDGQNQLSQMTTGAYIKNLTRQNLGKLKIPIPELIKQKNLFYLHQNVIQQEKLQMRKIQIKRDIINSTIKNIIGKQAK